MASLHAERFMNALQRAERTGDVAALVDLFTEDAELSNLSGTEPHRGVDGAREFWHEYLDAFDCILSRFTNVFDAPGAVVLEWASEGSLRNGPEISYRGVSVLETDDQGQVRRLRTYHEPAATRPVAVEHG
jgi:ketosteroid isomerase-like protein